MKAILRHGPRMAVSLLPLLLALLHVLGAWPMEPLQRLDQIIYDARLKAALPQGTDERIVIVDIDEQSLAEQGRWPWPRDRVAALVDELFERQGVRVLGLDTVFAEPDESAGHARLQALARDEPALAQRLQALLPELDLDARLAQALRDRPVVLGYYFTSDRQARTSGVLPAPVFTADALRGQQLRATRWDGHGANLPALAEAAPRAGFFNAIADSDGVVRSLPLLAEHQGRYYESLALAVLRLTLGDPAVAPVASAAHLPGQPAPVHGLRLLQPERARLIPLDERATVLVPFRGAGGPQGGSFRYVPATDLLSGRLPPGSLQGRIALLGTTAPGLMDLRATPMSETFPGVEVHANLIAGLLDERLPVRPDYAPGAELVQVLLVGLMLALLLPRLSALGALLLSAASLLAVVGLNLWLFSAHGLVLPLASVLFVIALVFVLDMSYGYLVESRSKRHLAQLFGTYVPPELVDEMLKDPDRYSMQAQTRELTVMFCDMRGFTSLSERLTPTELQALLNRVFSRLTRVIRRRRGTIDKYMGDCVMAFWGAPLDEPAHAALAVQTAWEMVAEVQAINREHAAAGLPPIAVGIGLNTGEVCVGDMGSDLRRSYTVVGDAVNLASRLEGLSKVYGVAVVAGETTRAQAPGWLWQALDRVQVKGKAEAVTIFTPRAPAAGADPALTAELALWEQALAAWRARDGAACRDALLQLRATSAENVLYRLYAERVASVDTESRDAPWTGTTVFDDK
ncbi:MAG TPA: adenylate/guanylate cyclase domain-containing protein [Hydrogenophaga sp.]|uniref:CHASE2 domain-containing protein n=1 Tax=Hydrogenophaga sp. TaxID=1904254 RepID=UPI002C11F6D2|nr:adenylate/guanylate cyclase domain-containing protein [Hydrogenophaga sp.]HMN92029.1 adenylate/guanylate cyclase domain-containing protein [Hydrogenophaga sp.]